MSNIPDLADSVFYCKRSIFTSMPVAGDLILLINKTSFSLARYFVITYASYLKMLFRNVSSVIFKKSNTSVSVY